MNQKHSGQPLEQQIIISHGIEQRMQQLVGAEILSSNHRENRNNWLTRFLPHSGIKRLEIRTALQLSVNILPFWICTFPLTCCSMALYWCIRLELNCSLVFAVIPYLRDLFLIHVVYNPVMYMSTSAEFQRAVVHLFRKLRSKVHCFFC